MRVCRHRRSRPRRPTRSPPSTPRRRATRSSSSWPSLPATRTPTACGGCAATSTRSSAPSAHATCRATSPAPSPSDRRPGTASSVSPGRASCTPSASCAAGPVSLPRRRATCCSIFAPTALDLCFELAAQIVAQLVESVAPVDETHGFRYFDDRDLTGFVDGTENPGGRGERGRDDRGRRGPAFAGGSYVMVQKYVHDLPRLAPPADGDPGGHHRSHQARGHRARRRRQAAVRAQRADHDSKRTARRSRSCATTCRSATPAAANRAPTSSATRARPGRWR